MKGLADDYPCCLDTAFEFSFFIFGSLALQDGVSLEKVPFSSPLAVTGSHGTENSDSWGSHVSKLSLGTVLERPVNSRRVHMHGFPVTLHALMTGS